MPEDKIVTIPFKPRFPQDEILKELATHRWSVVIAHRRLGKTMLLINHLIKMAMLNNDEAPQYAIVGPFRVQMKLIAWEAFRKYAGVIPDVRFDEQELYVHLPGNRKIFLLGSDNTDSLRGIYLHGVVLDEAAQIKPSLFYEVLRPALSDKKGWCVWSGTPKGMSGSLFEIYNTANKEIAAGNKDWWSGLYRADESNVIPKKELEELAEVIPASIFRQEFLCDFSAASDNVLITIDSVTAAMNRRYTQADVEGAPKIIGVDVARFGDDSSIIIKRQGLQCFEPIIMKKVSNMDLVGRLIQEIRLWKPDATFIDAGQGSGVIDRCRQLGYRVIEVPFGGMASHPQEHKNKRSEIWCAMRDWLEAGGALPQNRELRTGLIAPTYSFDAANRIVLIPKDVMRSKYGKVTGLDESDALALTFAFPVRVKNQSEWLFPQEKKVYDPYVGLELPYPGI